MEDTTACPICKNKLRTIKLPERLLYPVSKISSFLERTCGLGMNHSLQFFVDLETGKVDFLKLSLNPKYSRFLEVDFVNQKCRIACYRNSEPQYVEIPKMVELDFPNLEKLKERISLYVTFS